MFALKSAVAAALLAAPALVVALPQSSGSECQPAQVQCCDTMAPGDSDHMRAVGKALKMNVDESKWYGTGCSQSGLLGLGGGTSCTTSPMCCEGNDFGGLIGLGCLPISIDL
ncbi:hypothetical protein CERSUDRAFT_96125 [Gelatoporia subvermispora B]|uniref:Hydrophobin n=1 Tax=Ceriporiopsis subvermispora (strain B) TaxID=914234 RepID=M2QV02_CERS8|nr:hypothetical protein CERSUDRAFT_96125 [Gelatoporia subvermispora B]